MSAFDDLCAALGLIWQYHDGAGRTQCAPPESRRAVLAAMGIPAETEGAAVEALATLPAVPDWRIVQPDTPAPLAPGTDWTLTTETGARAHGSAGTPLPPLSVGIHRLDTEAGPCTLLAAPARLPDPAPAWGVTVPLYGLWQDAQAGVGSYADMARLARDLAPLGGGFLGINPVHAGFADAQNFSPYAPSHRRRWNVLHIDAGARHADTGTLVDYASVLPAQLAALQARFDMFGGDPSFDLWQAAQGQSLRDFATHQALSDLHGPYWTGWPTALRAPHSPAVRRFAAENPRALRFHAWCQWMAECQLGRARDAAAGLVHGLYLDLAVGTHPAGAETWAEPGLFARGVSLGAPPDLLGPSGQRWNLAPIDPRALARDGFAALAQTLRQQLRFAGVLRIDHILGFERAFWLPDTLPGLYVRMPRDALLAVVRIEATRAGAVIIGEDLGTIPDGLRDALAAAGILGCRVAMFERDWAGTGAHLPAEAYSPHALTSFGTHDLPVWAGWRQGRDIDWRTRLGEIPLADAPALHQARKAEVAGFDAAAGTHDGDPVALHAFLARTPAPLVAFQAEDICRMLEQPNLPGTVHEHPNWRRRLPLSRTGVAQSPALRDSAAQFHRIRQPETRA